MSFFNDTDRLKQQESIHQQQEEAQKSQQAPLGPDAKIRANHFYSEDAEAIADEMFENLTEAIRKRFQANESTRGEYKIYDHTKDREDGNLTVPRDLEYALQKQIVETLDMDWIDVEVHATKETNGNKGINIPFYRMAVTLYLNQEVR